MPYIELRDGLPLYYEEHGEGRPILLVPGWTITTRFWERQVGDVGRDPDDVCDRATRCLDHLADVVPRLARLCCGITRPDDPQLLVECNLAGDEKRVPDLDPVRIGPRQRVRPTLGRDHLLLVAHAMNLRSIVTAAQ